MNGVVIYLNAWLDCPDVILRRNYAMQQKITEAKIHFLYKLKEEGASEERVKFQYRLWIQKNRKRIRAVGNEEINNFDTHDSDDAG
jgi:hypothetical protein